ncbi:ATP-binding protein [Terasakiella sp. A23]|uniref:ATP-binding protein n=1 Tax=Terasakiella sp. FCG-A23 TaxID=3080561 RepID=UPI0029545940|nr:ATP-binding protein [Terasakiella sp. A23]MDV7339242.1 ATP-binding protein [Terasakiella sp. A23]
MIGKHQCCFIFENDPDNRQKLQAVMEGLGLRIIDCDGLFVCEKCIAEPDLVIIGEDAAIPEVGQEIGNVELLIRESHAPVLAPVHYQKQLLERFENVQVYHSADLLRDIAWALVTNHAQRRVIRNDLVRAAQGVQHMEEAVFTFQNLEEAQALALLIASLAPEKKLLRLGLGELFINAVEHGNLEIGSEEKLKLRNEGRWLDEIDKRLEDDRFKDRQAHLYVRRKDGGVDLKIEDHGNGFDWETTLERTAGGQGAEKGGRGLVIAQKAGLEKLRFVGKGNVLECSFVSEGQVHG